MLKVTKYFQFDPTEDYLMPPLQGWRLVDGEYLPIPLINGRLYSQILGLHLERDGKELRLFDPVTGRRLLKQAERLEAAEAALGEEKVRADAKSAETPGGRPTGFVKRSKHFVVGRTLSERNP